MSRKNVSIIQFTPSIESRSGGWILSLTLDLKKKKKKKSRAKIYGYGHIIRNDLDLKNIMMKFP